MQTVLLVIHLILAIALVTTVLLQRSEGGALGIGGGGGGGGPGGGLMSPRAAGSALTRITAILAAAFMSTSLALAIIANQGAEPATSTILDRPAIIPAAPDDAEAPAAPGPAVPTVPMAE